MVFAERLLSRVVMIFRCILIVKNFELTFHYGEQTKNTSRIGRYGRIRVGFIKQKRQELLLTLSRLVWKNILLESTTALKSMYGSWRGRLQKSRVTTNNWKLLTKWLGWTLLTPLKRSPRKSYPTKWSMTKHKGESRLYWLFFLLFVKFKHMCIW